jgi:BirA family biotin operon repressor/biotin-[acetyl-CoA-carboxylase] ligase
MGNTISSSVAGIGLNVNQTEFRSSLLNPVSLAQVTGREHDLSMITGELIRLLDMRYAMVISGRTDELAEAYHNSLYRCGEWHRYSDHNGVFRGMIERVGPGGL